MYDAFLQFVKQVDKRKTGCLFAKSKCAFNAAGKKSEVSGLALVQEGGSTLAFMVDLSTT